MESENPLMMGEVGIGSIVMVVENKQDCEVAANMKVAGIVPRTNVEIRVSSLLWAEGS